MHMLHVLRVRKNTEITMKLEYFGIRDQLKGIFLSARKVNKYFSTMHIK